MWRRRLACQRPPLIYPESTARVAPGMFKALVIQCPKICSWTRKPEILLEIRNKDHIPQRDQPAYCLQAFQDFKNIRKKA